MKDWPESLQVFGRDGALVRTIGSMFDSDPVWTVAIILVALVILIIQSASTVKQIWTWLKTGVFARVVLVFGLVLLTLVSWWTGSKASELSLPRPVELVPNSGAVQFGTRIVFDWSPPQGRTKIRENGSPWEIEFRQHGAIKRIEVPAPKHSIYPWTSDLLDEGEFEWRVRRTNPRSNWSEWTKVSAFRSHLSRVKATRKLRIGLFDEDLRPYIYADSESEYGISGVEVDLATLVTRELGLLLRLDLTPVFVRNGWLYDGNVGDVRSGVVDVVFGDTTRSHDREEQYKIQFLEPYLESMLGIVSLGTDPPLLDRGKLNGEVVVGWADSTASEVIERLGGSLKGGQSTPDMFQALDDRAVRGVVDDHRTLDCEVERVPPGQYLHTAFTDLAQLHLSFEYPEPVSPYVSMNVSVSELHTHLNSILARPDVKKEVESSLARHQCKPSAALLIHALNADDG